MRGQLIYAEQLAEKQNCLIFDCSFNLIEPAAGRRQYATAHIPGAYHADLDKHLSAELSSLNNSEAGGLTKNPLWSVMTKTSARMRLACGGWSVGSVMQMSMF